MKNISRTSHKVKPDPPVYPSGLRAYTERGPDSPSGLTPSSCHGSGLEDISSSGPGPLPSPGNGGASSGPPDPGRSSSFVPGSASGISRRAQIELLSAIKGEARLVIPGKRRAPKRAQGPGSSSSSPGSGPRGASGSSRRPPRRAPGSPEKAPDRAPGAGSFGNYAQYIAKSRFSPGAKPTDKPEEGPENGSKRLPGAGFDDEGQKLPEFWTAGSGVRGKKAREGLKFVRCVACGSWVVVRACENGHGFAKSIDCGREWCEKCRASSHGRRLARWLPKAQKLSEIGYFVITWPVEDRPRRARECRELGEKIYRFLKRRGFSRGLRRWHWFGEKPGVWHPHLNLLVEGGWLEMEKILEIRSGLRAILGSEINLNYRYFQSVAKIFHKLKYITRPTWKDEAWAPELKDEFFNFRNTGWWGSWDDEDKWALPESEKGLANFRKIEAGICPTCGKKLSKCKVWNVSALISTPALPRQGEGWEQIWDNVWQYKGPPENVLMYRLFREYRGSLEKEGSGGEL